MLRQARTVKYGSFCAACLSVQCKRWQRGGGGGDHDSVSTALRPQLGKRHSIKTLVRNIDRKQTKLTEENAALYETNTQKEADTHVRKRRKRK